MLSKSDINKFKAALGEAKPKRKSRRRPKSAAVNSVASSSSAPVRIRRTDYFFTVKVPSGKTEGGDVKDFSPNELNVLSKFAKIYECFLVHSVSVSFSPMMSKNAAGQIIVAIDYGAKNTPDKVSKASLLVMANRVGPITNKLANLPVRVNPTEVRYTDPTDASRDKPFTVLVYASGVSSNSSEISVGDIMVSYDITFYGLKP